MPVADTIAGQVVADAIAEVRRLLAHESAWTPDSDGLDAGGRWLVGAEQIRTLAARRGLLGAVETVTRRLEGQVAVTAALRDAIAAAGRRYARDRGEGLPPLFFQSIHTSTARRRTTRSSRSSTTRWPTAWGCSWALPDRTLTASEHDDVCMELQGIWMFFESVPYAAQYSSTVSMIDAVTSREVALSETLRQHRPPVALSERWRRFTKQLRAWRRHLASPCEARYPIDDIPF